jgi:hypothetical protein
MHRIQDLNQAGRPKGPESATLYNKKQNIKKK